MYECSVEQSISLRLYNHGIILLVLSENPLADWSIFDHVFTSSDMGERAPNLGSYCHVLKAVDVEPERLISLDDQFENVFSARSLGMHAMVCKTPEALERDLRNLLRDPVKRGRKFLRRNAGHLDRVSQLTDRHAGRDIKENCTQLLILKAMGGSTSFSLCCWTLCLTIFHRFLVNFVDFPGKWKFFQGCIPFVFTQIVIYTCDRGSPAHYKGIPTRYRHHFHWPHCPPPGQKSCASHHGRDPFQFRQCRRKSS